MTIRFLLGGCALSLAAALSANAQAPRSMTFETTLPDGSTLVLELEDQDFSSPEYDGSMVFTGQSTSTSGSTTQVTFRTDTGFLATATALCAVTLGSTSTALAFTQDTQVVALSETTTEVNNAATTTQLLTGGSTGSLASTGSYADLESAAANLHTAGSVQLAIAQSLTFAVNGLLTCANSDHVNFRECQNAAANICGSGCVASVEYEFTTDGNGNITSSSCDFTCKNPCPG